MKTCTKCGEGKPLTEFYLRSSATGKRMAECKECSRARLYASREPCAVVDCDRTRYSRTEWCSLHYGRVRAWGTPDGDPAKADPSYRGPAPACGTKTCTVCDTEKPLAGFYRRSQKRLDGEPRYFSECKECTKSRVRESNARYAARAATSLPAAHTCSSCHRTLPSSDFSLNRSRARGIQNICKECFRARRYGLSRDALERLLDEQGGVCAICGEPCSRIEVLCIDHDHATGAVRGLLCTGCNLGLGGFADDPDRLIAAAAYILRNADVLRMVR